MIAVDCPSRFKFDRMLAKGSSEPSVAYKGGTRLLNPEHNRPVAGVRLAVVKGSAENCQEDANMLAQREAVLTEQFKQQEKNKVDRVDCMVRMNVSKFTEERSRQLNETRRIKVWWISNIGSDRNSKQQRQGEVHNDSAEPNQEGGCQGRPKEDRSATH